MTTYFVNCKNLDELKKVYKALAVKHHPDVGGDTATMQAINAEYEARFEVLKRSQNEQAAADTTGRTRATTESAGGFQRLPVLHGLAADPQPAPAQLDLQAVQVQQRVDDGDEIAGCRWSSQKKLWSWHFAEDGSRWHKGSKTMAQIRAKYGSTTFSREAAMNDALPA